MDAQWIAIAVNAVAIIIVFVGRTIQFGKVLRQIEDSALAVAAMSLNLDRLRIEVGEHKIEVARNYATNADVERAIDRLESTLRQYLDAMTRQKD